MNYSLNDTTSYGIYNGISSFDLTPYIMTRAEEIGCSHLDYRVSKIVHMVNEDKDLLRMAQESYQPYPCDPSWREDYKAEYIAQMENKTAPGYGVVPDEAVYAIIDAALEEAYITVTKPRMAEMQKRIQEREAAEAFFVSIDTTVADITDEGGKTAMFTHTFVTKSGRTLVFTDRNVFDFGRVINPSYPILPGMEPGGLALRNRDGVMTWRDFSAEEGWKPVRPLDEEENAAFIVMDYIGHSYSRLRM